MSASSDGARNLPNNKEKVSRLENKMVQKVFKDKKNMGTFFCRECGKSKQIDISEFIQLNKEIRLKYTCSCKHIVSVVIERRQDIRKTVSLKGYITRKKTKIPIRIMDVSRYGIKIKTINNLEFQSGEKVVVEFILDDTIRSEVIKDMIVRTVSSDGIGLEFESYDHYDRFGTYILFHFS